MELVFTFIRLFARNLAYLSPLVVFLMLCIFLIGMAIGRLEQWSRFDALYHAFINSTTVGYGDFHPTRKISKILSIACAFIGLLLSGIVVASAVSSIQGAFSEVHNISPNSF